MRQANERRCYNVTLPLVSRAHIKSDHCNMKTFPFQWTDLSFYDTKLQPKNQQETVVLWVYFLCGHFSMIGEWQFLAVRLKFNLGEIICCQQKRQINHTISPSYTLELWTHKQKKKNYHHKWSSIRRRHTMILHQRLMEKLDIIWYAGGLFWTESYCYKLCISSKTWFNPIGAEAKIFWENKVNTMVADAMATQGAMASAAMVLAMQMNPCLP